MLQICENIKQARLSTKKTQQEVANYLEEKRSTYANWESTIEPDIATLKRIAKFLDIDLSELLASPQDKRTDNFLQDPEVPIKKGEKEQDINSYNLNTLIQSNKNLTDAKLMDSEAGLLLAQTNATLTARVLQNIDAGIKNEPEILEALNANMRGLLDAIAKVAAGTRYESEEVAVAELGKIVHEKHRKSLVKDKSPVGGN